MELPRRFSALVRPAALLSAALICAAAPAPATGQADATPPPWQVRAPGGLGLDPAILARAYRRAGEMGPLSSLLVARRGTLVAERYWHGLEPGEGVNVKSVAKSVVSALVGVALEEGHLEGLDRRVAGLLPEYFDPDTDPRKRRITLRHLLTMTAGLETTSFHNYGPWVNGDDWVAGALGQPVVAEPGEEMIYSTGSSHLLSVILTRAAGRSTRAFARDHLFGPLGVRVDGWQRDPQGYYFGGNNMALSSRDLWKFGELYRSRGRWEGRRILPEGWVSASWERRVVSDWNGFGFGYGWWARTLAGHEVRYAWGHGGQFLFVVPELELVVVVTSVRSHPGNGDRHRRAVYGLLERHLIPAATGSPNP